MPIKMFVIITFTLLFSAQSWAGNEVGKYLECYENMAPNFVFSKSGRDKHDYVSANFLDVKFRSFTIEQSSLSLRALWGQNKKTFSYLFVRIEKDKNAGLYIVHENGKTWVSLQPGANKFTFYDPRAKQTYQIDYKESPSTGKDKKVLWNLDIKEVSDIDPRNKNFVTLTDNVDQILFDKLKENLAKNLEYFYKGPETSTAITTNQKRVILSNCRDNMNSSDDAEVITRINSLLLPPQPMIRNMGSRSMASPQ